jgi:hypothetical protein
MSGIPVSSKAPAKDDENSLNRALKIIFNLRLEVEAAKESSRTLALQLTASRNDLATMTRLNAELDAQLKALRQRKGPGGPDLDHCSAMLKTLSQHVKKLAVGIDDEVAKLKAAADQRARPSARARGGAPAAAPVRGPSNVPAAQQLNPPPPQLNPLPVVKKEQPVPTGRHHPYQRPGGAAAGSSVRVVDSAPAIPTGKLFCTCGEEVRWFCHNFELPMCDACKIHHEEQTFDGPHAFSKVSGRLFVREASRPLPTSGEGGAAAAGPRVVMSAPAVPANPGKRPRSPLPLQYYTDDPTPLATRFCSCDGSQEAMWYCHECKKSMCRECEGDHRMTVFVPPHSVTNLSGRPRVGEGSRP